MGLFDDREKAGNGKVRPCRVVVAGIGGAGCNALGRMCEVWTSGPAMFAVNTDAQALAGCAVPAKLQIGQNLTQGLGAGGDTNIGKLAAEDDGDALRDIVCDADIVFIVTGLGGGTGTGAAPILARIAREEGALTVCFATTPFAFEGERRRRQAEDGLRMLRMHADVVISLPNEALLEMLRDQTSLIDAFTQADISLGVAIRAIWKLLSQTGIINLNFADVRHLVDHSGGSCSFGYGEGSGPDKTGKALAELVKNPLLDHGNALAHSGALMVNIVGGPDVTLMDIQAVMSKITSIARSDVKLFMGACVDEEWGGRIGLCVLAAENWQEETYAAAAEKTAPGVELVDDESDRKSGAKAVQSSLNFEPTDKGRFKNVEPTLHDGEDLDIPTYIRRGIKLSFEK